MTTLQLATLATAILGAVLGIINTWHQLSKDKVRLRVVPKMAFMTGPAEVMIGDRPHSMAEEFRRRGTPRRLCVEVINLSAFPVTISGVGFGKTAQGRYALTRPDVTPGKSWPTRLEPREAVTVFAGINEDLAPSLMSEPVAYAKTDCGVTQYGNSPILTAYVAELRGEHGGTR